MLSVRGTGDQDRPTERYKAIKSKLNGIPHASYLYIMRHLYKYFWGNNPVRKKLKGRECIALAFGKRNSVLIKFIDNGSALTRHLGNLITCIRCLILFGIIIIYEEI